MVFHCVNVCIGCIKNSEVSCFDLHVSIPVIHHTASLELIVGISGV
jgi:hypothetical protein